VIYSNIGGMSMNKNLIIVVLLVLTAGGVYLFSQTQTSKQPVPRSPSPKIIKEEEASPEATLVTQTVNMVSENFSFTPKTFTVKKGQEVTMVVQNSGVHNFIIDELGVRQDLKEGENIFRFTPTQAGSFEFYCGISNHRQMGMFGTMTVVE